MKDKIYFEQLKDFYINKQKSSREISDIFKCSEHKINYWISKYKIPKRTISEAIYIKNNPKGDPFKFCPPKTLEEAKLFGLGLGIYWGEGNKANKNTVKIGNSNPSLIKIFMRFLKTFFRVKKKNLKFQLQIFSDINLEEAEEYWMNKLKISRVQMYKTIITKSGSLGTYRHKSLYGVISLYYSNTKLRNILINLLPM